jgi:hypothetical protein
MNLNMPFQAVDLNFLTKSLAQSLTKISRTVDGRKTFLFARDFQLACARS